jgi:hypothetical protein
VGSRRIELFYSPSKIFYEYHNEKVGYKKHDR